MKQLIQNNWFRFSITFLFCLLYSLLRETSYSTFVKPLPILFWLLIVINSSRIGSANWLIYALITAAMGDILLDLGTQWLKIGAIPFLVSTAFLAYAFYTRLKRSEPAVSLLKKMSVIFLAFIPFAVLYVYIRGYSDEAATTGLVLFTLSAFLIANALANLIFNRSEHSNIIKPILGFAGACSIVANFVLYSVDLYVTPIPRDLVIQVYYWGTAFVTWSFID